MNDDPTGGPAGSEIPDPTEPGGSEAGWWTRPEAQPRLGGDADAATTDAATDAATTDAATTDAATNADPTDADPEAGPGMSRGRVALLAGLVVLALVALVVAVTRDDSTAPSAAPSTTASSTTTVAPWPATEARIATARNPSIIVHSQPPAGWDDMEPAEEWDNPLPPASQSTMPPREPFPSEELPIQGRYVDASGWSFNNPTGWGDAFVMLVTEQRGDWMKVEIPVRPNGTPGYVAAADVEMSTTNYRLDLRLGTRTLTLYDGDEVVLTTPVVIGKNETRTPTGRFYITDEYEQSDPMGAYGPIALPTNAYSEQIDEFDNGVPVIALHGTNRPELVGQDVSNGCVRVPNEQITKIAELIPAGTPIDIWA